MRKWMLISALLLASASAHAGPSRGLVLAAADTPAATTTDAPAATTPDTAKPIAQPLPPASQTDSAKDGIKDGTKDTAKPQIVDVPKPRSSKPHSQARRHESDEAMARRIAAKYGISW